MESRLEALEARVGRLELEVEAMRGGPEPVPTPPPPIPPAPHAASVISSAPSAAVPGAPALAPRPMARPPDPLREAVLAGTWLARIGMAAVLLGAAFAFKYAVDRGLIGPTGRVAIGLAAAVGFVVWGERARARDWPRLAQALSGGGVGLAYLSVWAAFGLYGLVPPAVAFALLTAVVGAGVALAFRHRSEALALVALLGAFLNPYLTGIERLPGPLFGYVLLVDLGVTVVAVARGWRLLEAAALTATWLVAAAAIGNAGPGALLTVAAASLVLFSGAVLVRVGLTRRGEELDIVVLAFNAAAFFGVAMAALGDVAGEPRGEVTVLLAGIHLGIGLLLRRFESPPLLWATFLSLGAVFTTIAVPLQLDGFAVPIAWTVEAVVLVAAGKLPKMSAARWTGAAVLAIALLDSVVFRTQLGFAYDPPRPLVSIESLTLLVQIAALAVMARLLGPGRPGSASAAAATLASVGAHLLAVTWLSFEARALILDSGLADPGRVTQFAFTAVWSLYAGVLLAVGIARRSRWLRLLAIGLFGATLTKMVVVDLWLLEPLHRTIAFTGLGMLLIAGSLLYHRFRDLVGGE